MSEAKGLPETGLKLVRRVAGRRFLRDWDVHVRGAAHVPEQGAVIIASNHLGWLDGPLMFIKAPRPVHALVKSEEFEGKHARLLRFISQIKVVRDRTDSGALRRAAQALRAGQAVGVFPEGQRGDGELADIKGGVGYLALLTGAPVVPMAIFGTREPGGASDSRPAKGARVDVVYGEPLRLDPHPWPRSTDVIAEAAETVHQHLRAHLAWAQHVTDRDLPGPMPNHPTTTGATDA